MIDPDPAYGFAVRNEVVLDVRGTHSPRVRHAMIFAAIDALATRSAVVLVSDHDLKPLYYRLHAEAPDGYTWTYVEAGPRVFRARIERRR